jgi:succinate dehydrogenase / fumarate reductase cytochrome b subunit
MEVFTNPVMVAFYVLSMVVVGSHLWHGFSSAFQSLGGDHPSWTPRVLLAGKIVAVLIAGGFITIALWAHLVGGRS